MKEKKKLKPIHIVIDVLFFGLIGFMVLCFTWNFIDIQSGYKYPLFGQRTTVIVSPSMAKINEANDYITSDMKQIQKYDVITTKAYKSYEDIQIYDVATYFSGSKDLICHRVVDKYEADGKQYVVFRGDANNVDDAPVSYELIRGKVVNVTPKVGHVVAFIQSPYMFIALFGTLFFVFLGMFIVNYKKDKKETNEGQEVPNEEAFEEPIDEKTPEDDIKEEQPVEEKPQEEAPVEEPHAVQPDEKMPEDDVIDEEAPKEEAEPNQESNKEEIPNDKKE